MRKSILLLLLLLCTAAISFAWDKPQNWLKVQSPHFVVITNGSEKQGRHVADQFERMRAVFQKAFPDLKVDPAAPLIVLATKEEKDFRALEPQEYLGKGKLRLGGYFLPAQDKNYVLVRLDVEGEHPYETVYHEYTHLLSSKEVWLPLWLFEGMAEFYQTTEVRDKEAILGMSSPENLTLLRGEPLLPLPVLFTVDHSSPYYHEENKGSIFYAESWALTHYFMIKDAQQHTSQLADYSDLLRQHVDSVTAATRAFGDLQKLQKELEIYITRSSFMAYKLPIITQVDESAYKVQPVSAAEADAVRADLLAHNRRTADARSLLEEVLKEDPNNASAHETMGFLEFHEGHLDEARKWYGQAVKLDSQSFLAHYYFAVMTMRSGSFDSDEGAQVESSLRAAIQLNPEFAPSYDALASFYARGRQKLDEAYLLELKAVTLDPANLAFRLNSANLLMSQRRSKDAVNVLRNAMNVAKNPEEQARVQAALQNAEQFEARMEQSTQSGRGEAVDMGQESAATDTLDTSAPPKLAHRSAAAANSEQSAPGPLEKEVTGPHRFVVGTIKSVRCSDLSTMDFVVASDGKEIVLHTPNYYKIQFSALGFTPDAELQPCTQMEGRPAKVEFIEPNDTTAKKRIVAVELHK